MAGALVLGLVAARGQPAAGAALASSQPGAPTVTVVCAGSDGILHAAETTGGCAPGQTATFNPQVNPMLDDARFRFTPPKEL